MSGQHSDAIDDAISLVSTVYSLQFCCLSVL